MSQQYKKLTIIPEDINILLVGETNAGKSTFVHAFANYVKYGQFSVAEENEVFYLSPSSLNGTNTSYTESSEGLGKRIYGQQKHDKSDIIPTKNICSYIFPLLRYGRRIHLIDTPGFDNIFKDTTNFDSILTYVSQIENLHAVCVVFNCSSSTEIYILQYRIKFLLMRLEKSVGKNIIFLFTHSTDCSPEYTDTVLKGILDQIMNSPSQAEIKRGKENVFCLENEAFHFLASAKDHVTHSNTIKKTYLEMWERSAAECQRIIEYILGKNKDNSEEITPHKVKNTILLHNAKKIISQAARFFVDIADIFEQLERDFVLTGTVLLQSTYSSQGYNSNTSSYENVQELIQKIERGKSVYKDDKDKIESVLHNLGVFVKRTAVLSCNDSYEAYIKYLINQNIRKAVKQDTQALTILDYYGLSKQYAEEMRIINKNFDASPIITMADLLEGIEQLKVLKKMKENFELLHKTAIATRTKQSYY